MSYITLSQATPATISLLNTITGYPDFLRLRGSVIPVIFPSVLSCAAVASLVCYIHFELGYNLEVSSVIIPSFSVVLGLLLVFRTNTSYDRYWDGRKCWSMLHANVRAFARLLWINVIDETTIFTLADKRRGMDLLVALYVSVKHYVREEYGINYPDLKHYIPMLFKIQEGGAVAMGNRNGNVHANDLGHTNLAGLSFFDFDMEDNEDEVWQCRMNLPGELIMHLALLTNRLLRSKAMDMVTFNLMTGALTAMTTATLDMDRIRATPIPLAYRIHMKQAVLIYCFTLPFTLIATLGYLTIPVATAVAFTLFGIDGIGREIENPFGYDKNDLDLDALCEELRSEIEFLRMFVPREEKSEDVQSQLAKYQ